MVKTNYNETLTLILNNALNKIDITVELDLNPSLEIYKDSHITFFDKENIGLMKTIRKLSKKHIRIQSLYVVKKETKMDEDFNESKGLRNFIENVYPSMPSYKNLLNSSTDETKQYNDFFKVFNSIFYYKELFLYMHHFNDNKDLELILILFKNSNYLDELLKNPHKENILSSDLIDFLRLNYKI